VCASIILSTLAAKSPGVVRYASLERFCSPAACHQIIMKNITRPHRNATTIQISSTLWIGSFHQMRSLGGEMAIGGSWMCWARRAGR
jgi:hypothetical protein